MAFLTRLFRRYTDPPPARGAVGHRAYAVGDVHGRLDLLERLIARIEADIASRAASQNVVVFLGDLIDRGPDSAGVIERLRTWRPAETTTIFLCGNHEEVLLNLLAGQPGLLGDWLKYGGGQCVASYGLDAERLRDVPEAEAIATIRAAIPAAHQDFIASFADTFRFGDYLFVHAGIRPGRPIAAQDKSDLRWIRAPFLDDLGDHGFIVVHGHTISEGVQERPNRIGVDTGAYRSGILTALGVEGDERWFLDTASTA